MRLLLVIFAFLSASSAADTYGLERRTLGNNLEDLLTQFLEYIRHLMISHDPYIIPILPDQHFVGTNEEILLSLSYIRTYRLYDFVIDSVDIDADNLNCTFRLSLPSSHDYNGVFTVVGSVLGKNVQGTGTFSINVTDLAVKLNAQLDVVGHSVQIQSISLDYSMGSLQGALQGLEVDGLTPEQINALVNLKLNQFLEEDKSAASQLIGGQLMHRLNNVLEGRSTSDVVAWLEAMVACTPDPPPF